MLTCPGCKEQFPAPFLFNVQPLGVALCGRCYRIWAATSPLAKRLLSLSHHAPSSSPAAQSQS